MKAAKALEESGDGQYNSPVMDSEVTPALIEKISELHQPQLWSALAAVVPFVIKGCR